MVAVQIGPAHVGQLIATSDRRFRAAIAHPGSHAVAYFLMPDPTGTPTAAIGRAYPRLWAGRLARVPARHDTPGRGSSGGAST